MVSRVGSYDHGELNDEVLEGYYYLLAKQVISHNNILTSRCLNMYAKNPEWIKI